MTSLIKAFGAKQVTNLASTLVQSLHLNKTKQSFESESTNIDHYLELRASSEAPTAPPTTKVEPKIKKISSLERFATGKSLHSSLQFIKTKARESLFFEQDLDPKMKQIALTIRNTSISISIFTFLFAASAVWFSIVDIKYSNELGGNGWREVASPDVSFPFIKFIFHFQFIACSGTQLSLTYYLYLTAKSLLENSNQVTL